MISLDMFPCPSTDDVIYLLPREAELSADDRTGRIGFFMDFSDLPNYVFRKFCVIHRFSAKVRRAGIFQVYALRHILSPMLFSRRPSVFRRRVRHVVLVCPLKQMCWVGAGRIVATMANIELERVFAVMQSIRDAMGKIIYVLDTEIPIVPNGTGSPSPAFALRALAWRLVHVFPKSRDIGWGKLRKRSTMFIGHLIPPMDRVLVASLGSRPAGPSPFILTQVVAA